MELARRLTSAEFAEEMALRTEHAIAMATYWMIAVFVGVMELRTVVVDALVKFSSPMWMIIPWNVRAICLFLVTLRFQPN